MIYDDLWFDQYGQCFLNVPETDREELEAQDLYPHLDMVIVERTAALRELMEQEGYGHRSRDHRLTAQGEYTPDVRIGKHHKEE